MSCENNLRQVSLAVHNYYLAVQQLPPAMGGTADSSYRLSGLGAMIPFLESSDRWDRISNPMDLGERTYPAMGPPPFDKNYPPWTESILPYLCPASGGLDEVNGNPFGQTNYTFCIGDSARRIHQEKPLDRVRGVFSPHVTTRFRLITDGLSSTVCMVEIGNARVRDRRGQFVINASPVIVESPIACRETLDPSALLWYAVDRKLSKLGRGGIWADGAAGHALVNTILPPNDPSCGLSETPTDGIFSASSYHVGGVHVMFADGRVEFIADSIDTGDLTATPPERVLNDQGDPIESPYGVWGEMGTRAGSVPPPIP